MSIEEILKFGILELQALGNPRLEAEVLLCHVLGVDRVWLRTHTQDELRYANEILYKKFIQKRSCNLPVAYVVGYTDWNGMRLKVNANVLIPRDETEVLVGYVQEELRVRGERGDDRKKSLNILDIGTGSGAILCGLIRECRFLGIECNALGVDVSEGALDVAKDNARNVLEYEEMKRVRFECSDLLGIVEEGSQWDIIVANLPYVPEGMGVSLEVQQEPDLALYSGVDGLDHYRRLFNQLNKKSVQFNSLWIEFLPQQKQDISQVFKNFQIQFFEDVGGDVFFARINRLLVD